MTRMTWLVSCVLNLMLPKHSRILCTAFELTVLLGLPRRVFVGAIPGSGGKYYTNGPFGALCRDCDTKQELTIGTSPK